MLAARATAHLPQSNPLSNHISKPLPMLKTDPIPSSVYIAKPEVVESVRHILGMNTLTAEERKIARQKARHILKVWLHDIGHGPDPSKCKDDNE